VEMETGSIVSGRVKLRERWMPELRTTLSRVGCAFVMLTLVN
jgi:hypothetical protein